MVEYNGDVFWLMRIPVCWPQFANPKSTLVVRVVTHHFDLVMGILALTMSTIILLNLVSSIFCSVDIGPTGIKHIRQMTQQADT